MTGLFGSGASGSGTSSFGVGGSGGGGLGSVFGGSSAFGSTSSTLFPASSTTAVATTAAGGSTATSTAAASASTTAPDPNQHYAPIVDTKDESAKLMKLINAAQANQDPNSCFALHEAVRASFNDIANPLILKPRSSGAVSDKKRKELKDGNLKIGGESKTVHMSPHFAEQVISLSDLLNLDEDEAALAVAVVGETTEQDRQTSAESALQAILTTRYKRLEVLATVVSLKANMDINFAAKMSEAGDEDMVETTRSPFDDTIQTIANDIADNTAAKPLASSSDSGYTYSEQHFVAWILGLIRYEKALHDKLDSSHASAHSVAKTMSVPLLSAARNNIKQNIEILITMLLAAMSFNSMHIGAAVPLIKEMAGWNATAMFTGKEGSKEDVWQIGVIVAYMSLLLREDVDIEQSNSDQRSGSSLIPSARAPKDILAHIHDLLSGNDTRSKWDSSAGLLPALTVVWCLFLQKRVFDNTNALTQQRLGSNVSIIAIHQLLKSAMNAHALHFISHYMLAFRKHSSVFDLQLPAIPEMSVPSAGTTTAPIYVNAPSTLPSSIIVSTITAVQSIVTDLPLRFYDVLVKLGQAAEDWYKAALKYIADTEKNAQIQAQAAAAQHVPLGGGLGFSRGGSSVASQVPLGTPGRFGGGGGAMRHDTLGSIHTGRSVRFDTAGAAKTVPTLTLQPLSAYQAGFEQYLLLVAATYHQRPDSALVFWSEPMLTRILHISTSPRSLSSLPSPHVQAAAAEALSALACGPQSSLKAHEFMTNKPHGAVFSWVKLITTIGNSATELRKSAEQGIHPADLLSMCGLLRLLKSVVKDSLTARCELFPIDDPQVVYQLFSLLGCRVPTLFKAEILNTIAAFGGPTPEWTDVPNASLLVSQMALMIWQMLEVSGILPISANQPGAQAPIHAALRALDAAGAVYELREVETPQQTYPMTRAFIELITSLIHLPPSTPLSTYPDPGVGVASSSVPVELGADSRKPGLGPYIMFALENVLLQADARPYVDADEKAQVKLACYRLIERCIATFDLSPVVDGTATGFPYTPSTPFEQLIESATQPDPAALRGLILHPGFELIMKLMHHTELLGAVQKEAAVDVNTLNESATSTHHIEVVNTVLRIIVRVLHIQDVFMNHLLAFLSRCSPAEIQSVLGLDPTSVLMPQSLERLDELLLLSEDVVPRISAHICCERSDELALVAAQVTSFLASNGTNSARLVAKLSNHDHGIIFRDAALLAVTYDDGGADADDDESAEMMAAELADTEVAETMAASGVNVLRRGGPIAESDPHFGRASSLAQSQFGWLVSDSGSSAADHSAIPNHHAVRARGLVSRLATKSLGLDQSPTSAHAALRLVLLDLLRDGVAMTRSVSGQLSLAHWMLGFDVRQVTAGVGIFAPQHTLDGLRLLVNTISAGVDEFANAQKEIVKRQSASRHGQLQQQQQRIFSAFGQFADPLTAASDALLPVDIENALHAPMFVRRPKVASLCYSIVSNLCSDPTTRQSVLDLLRTVHIGHYFSTQLLALPSSSYVNAMVFPLLYGASDDISLGVRERTILRANSALRQCASSMDTLSTELYDLGNAVTECKVPASTLQNLVRLLVDPGFDGTSTQLVASSSAFGVDSTQECRVLGVLEGIVSLWKVTASNLAEYHDVDPVEDVLTSDEFRVFDGALVSNVVTSTTSNQPQQSYFDIQSFLYKDPRGCTLYDLPLLANALRAAEADIASSSASASGSGSSSSSMIASVRAREQARRLILACFGENHQRELMHALLSTLSSWRQLVEVILSPRLYAVAGGFADAAFGSCSKRLTVLTEIANTLLSYFSEFSRNTSSHSGDDSNVIPAARGSVVLHVICPIMPTLFGCIRRELEAALELAQTESSGGSGALASILTAQLMPMWDRLVDLVATDSTLQTTRGMLYSAMSELLLALQSTASVAPLLSTLTSAAQKLFASVLTKVEEKGDRLVDVIAKDALSTLRWATPAYTLLDGLVNLDKLTVSSAGPDAIQPQHRMIGHRTVSHLSNRMYLGSMMRQLRALDESLELALTADPSISVQEQQEHDAVLQLAEAILVFFVRVAQSGSLPTSAALSRSRSTINGASSGIERLLSNDLFEMLASCRFYSCPASVDGSNAQLAFHRLLTPTLRLVLAVLSGTPVANQSVVSRVSGFLVPHSDALVRVLQRGAAVNQPLTLNMLKELSLLTSIVSALATRGALSSNSTSPADKPGSSTPRSVSKKQVAAVVRPELASLSLWTAAQLSAFSQPGWISRLQPLTETEDVQSQEPAGLAWPSDISLLQSYAFDRVFDVLQNAVAVCFDANRSGRVGTTSFAPVFTWQGTTSASAAAVKVPSLSSLVPLIAELTATSKFVLDKARELRTLALSFDSLPLQQLAELASVPLQALSSGSMTSAQITDRARAQLLSSFTTLSRRLHAALNTQQLALFLLFSHLQYYSATVPRALQQYLPQYRTPNAQPSVAELESAIARAFPNLAGLVGSSSSGKGGSMEQRHQQLRMFMPASTPDRVTLFEEVTKAFVQYNLIPQLDTLLADEYLVGWGLLMSEVNEASVLPGSASHSHADGAGMATTVNAHEMLLRRMKEVLVVANEEHEQYLQVMQSY
ncbi:hypothetical protein GQ42DRAFT_160585 [Ramicandelaber brevisporus]|nr:hypothetical protein GQ42DRAFT_160585 [Ramicandelaber brevisporus]